MDFIILQFFTKVDEGVRMPPKMMKSSVNTQRRGTIIPDDDERVNRSRASLQQFPNGGIINTVSVDLISRY